MRVHSLQQSNHEIIASVASYHFERTHARNASGKRVGTTRCDVASSDRSSFSAPASAAVAVRPARFSNAHNTASRVSAQRNNTRANHLPCKASNRRGARGPSADHGAATISSIGTYSTVRVNTAAAGDGPDALANATRFDGCEALSAAAAEGGTSAGGGASLAVDKGIRIPGNGRYHKHTHIRYVWERKSRKRNP
jgi:hypothetical protein